MKNSIKINIKSWIGVSLLAFLMLWSCGREDDISSGSLLPLTIKSITPESGVVGSSIIINGTNFSEIPENNLVSFNGIIATVTSSNKNSITAKVPVNATSGNISVTVNNEEAPGPIFTVTLPPPTITSVTPNRGAGGRVIVIEGTNFSPLIEDNKLMINGLEAVINETTSTKITASVPLDAPAGTSAIVLTVQGVSITGPEFTVPPAVTIIIPIDEGEGDVEEAADGRMRVGDTDIEIAEWNTAATPDYGEQNCGFRFNNVQIPPGAIIASASIQFTVDGTGSNPAEMTIFGENVGHALQYDEITPANSVSGRTLTTASVVWDILPWLAIGDKLAAQKTADLKTIIQEIINRGDWVSGNSLNLIMKPSGISTGLTTSNTAVGREAETFESNFPPELIITYLE